MSKTMEFKIFCLEKNSEIFNIFRDRLKAIVEGTSEIGWGFHEELGSIYSGIKWLELQDVDFEDQVICKECGAEFVRE
jgi:hypothetical protein